MLNIRFNLLAKQAESPFEGAGVSDDEIFRSARVFGLAVQAKPEKWKEALAAAEAELRRACEYGFSEQELEMVASSLLTAAQSAQDSWETVTCDSLAGEIISALTDRGVGIDSSIITSSLKAIISAINRSMR